MVRVVVEEGDGECEDFAIKIGVWEAIWPELVVLLRKGYGLVNGTFSGLGRRNQHRERNNNQRNAEEHNISLFGA